MSEKNNKAKDRTPIVTGIEKKPCGCVLKTFSDDTTGVEPCFPCGLRELGDLHFRMSRMYGVLSMQMAKRNSELQVQAAVNAIGRK